MSHGSDNVYTIDIQKYDGHNKCFSSMHDQSWLWHRKLGHANMDFILQPNKNELVRGFLKINFQKDQVCEACQVGKKKKIENKILISTSRPLDLLQTDPFCPFKTPGFERKV